MGFLKYLPDKNNKKNFYNCIINHKGLCNNIASYYMLLLKEVASKPLNFAKPEQDILC